jgi:hypothetical protein
MRLFSLALIILSSLASATEYTRLPGELEGKNRIEVIKHLGKPLKKITVFADDGQILEVWYWKLKDIKPDSMDNSPYRIEYRQVAFRKGQNVVCSDGYALGDNGREIGIECEKQKPK